MKIRLSPLQPLMCFAGHHVRPVKRIPLGPVVSFCDCCQTYMISYSQDLAFVGYEDINVPNFPKVIGTVSEVGRLPDKPVAKLLQLRPLEF